MTKMLPTLDKIGEYLSLEDFETALVSSKAVKTPPASGLALIYMKDKQFGPVAHSSLQYFARRMVGT